MKLLALRVAAFRRFDAPVAVEAFGDGINVLGGPNETGKSTLFHALEAAFLTRFKVTGAALELMRPYAGGEPLVEVEFEAGGERWCLRKQFGRGAGASLMNLATGTVAARNSEAEERIAALTGRPSELPGPVGLVWVRQQRALLPPDPDLDPETGKEKPRGERAALRDLIGREIEAAAVGGAFEAVRERTSRALDALLTPTRSGVRKDGPLYAALALREEAKAKRDEARSAAAAAEKRLGLIAEMSSRLAELESAAPDSARARLSDLEARHAVAVTERAERNLAREALKAREAQWNAAQEVASSLRALKDALQAKRDAHATAQTLAKKVESLVSELNADPATPAAVDRLTTLDRTRAVAEAELQGHAATVDIRLEETGKGKVRVGGAPLVEDQKLAVVEPVEIRIDGIATIAVSTPQAARGAELRTKSAEAASEIETGLSRLGVASLEEARQRAANRAQKISDLESARGQLKQIAPNGPEKVADEVRRLEASLKEAEERSLSDDGLSQLKTQAGEAHLKFEALNARALSDQSFSALEAELAHVRRAASEREAEIKRLTNDLAHVRGELAGIDEAGRAAELASCEGEFDRAEDEARRLQHEASSLKLLEVTLTDVEKGAEAAYAEPVSRRLSVHLKRVFGPSELSFKNDFAVEALKRGGAREDVASLSDGTREQLSVLVRLAFAEVLAESGRPVPLVLDDPLAYSDDARLAAVCAELAASKSVPQIILLTCREKAFEILPGRRLTVTNWRPERR